MDDSTWATTSLVFVLDVFRVEDGIGFRDAFVIFGPVDEVFFRVEGEGDFDGLFAVGIFDKLGRLEGRMRDFDVLFVFLFGFSFLVAHLAYELDFGY